MGGLSSDAVAVGDCQSLARPPRRIIRADVRHAVITAVLPRRASRTKVEEIANEIAAESHPWWLLLKDWIEVTTPHMLVTLDPSGDFTLARNTRAWVWNGTRGRSVPLSPNAVQLVLTV